MTIRRMKEGDLDVVSDLAMLANPFAEKSKYRRHLEEELEDNSDLAFVAVKTGRVVGYVMGDVHGSRGTLEDIAVERDMQHRGIGNLLLKAELEALTKRNPKIIVAEVHYKCSSAIPFYYKHGFRISGVCRNFFGMKHDAIMLELLIQ
ncbi:GNAT family N-acetyltransferase [Candidatus Bathyarchaeota archaeon]|nr:GNAT family N-acetyltransferase [Candidatus Bathyarchaeota archaeon]